MLHRLARSEVISFESWCPDTQLDRQTDSRNGPIFLPGPLKWSAKITIKCDYPRRRLSHGQGVQRHCCVCLSVSLLFAHDVSKTDAARVIRLDTDVVYHESWKRSKVKFVRHKKIFAGVCSALVGAAFF